MTTQSENFERIRSALSYLSPEDRDDWVKYGMCIKNELGDEGFELWDEWGSQSEKHKASSAKSTWKSMKADGKRTIASLFYDAKAAGWKDSGTYKKPSKEEIEARKAAAAARAAKAAEEEAITHAAAAERAQAIWDAATPVEGDGHPYLLRKGVVSHELRVGRWDIFRGDTGEVIIVSEQALLVPIRDRKRNLWSLQAIFPNDKNLLRRDKYYLKDSAKSGNFFPIGQPQKRDGRLVFILGEGYATCASVHAATGHMVLVCFDTSNLLVVATALRESRPDAWIVFAADNDTHTANNPGVTKARAAADAVGGLVAVPPPGDFNDLHLSQGLDAVAEVIEEVLIQVENAAISSRNSDTNGAALVSMRDEDRRRQQQEQNMRLQEIDAGAMIPNDISIDEMIARCMYIAEGKYVAYVTEDRSMVLKFDDFCALTTAAKTEIDESQKDKQVKKLVLNAKCWLNDRRRKDAMIITFHPGKPIITANPNGMRAVNTWRPIKRWPAKADINLFLVQVEYLFPDSLERGVFLDFLAHIEQKPGELPHFGWLHIAENTGTGRNWLASVLARVFRGYVAPNVDLPALLDSAFNGELASRVLAIVDEVQEGASEGNYRHAERLKSMINAEVRTVNQKYGPKYQEFNACRWLVFSNHKNALPLNDEDRRFRVVIHKAQPRLPEVYESLYAALDDPEFINAVGVFLRERDISKFKPGERPPLNEAKRAAISASKPMSTQHAEEIVDWWPADVISYNDAAALLSGDPEKKDFPAGMRRAMEEVGCIPWERGAIRRIKMNRAPHRFWILRNHEKWQAQSPETIRKEAGRAKVNGERPAAAVLADAIELASLDECPI